MSETLLRGQSSQATRPDYSSWLQSLKMKARAAEQEELEELEWLARRRAG